VYTQYFYPEVASLGQLMSELFINLQHEFDITVICAVPNYTGQIDEHYKKKLLHFESFNNINIIRVKVPEVNKEKKLSRIFNILSFFFNSIIATFKSGPQDVIFVTSQPPILAGILGIFGKKIKRAKLVYNIQDFNPEQTEAINYVKSGIVFSIARYLDKLSCRKSDLVILVGHDMQKTLENRFKTRKVPANAVVNNWVNEKDIYPLPKTHFEIEKFKEENGLDSKFIIMYSGNIGLYYDLENIIKIADKFKNNDDVHFVFIGEGAVKKQLVDYCKDHRLDNVSFLPYQPKDKLIYSLNAADVHLVTNQKGIKGISVPSKIYGVMAVGKPVIGVLEEGSEARLLIEDSGCGICVEPQDYDGIVNAINELYAKREQLPVIGMRGREYLEKHCSMESSINKYKQLLLNI